MALYSFAGSVQANAAQNDLDAQEMGYASYADMIAAQGSSPWTRIAAGEQVDVFSTLATVGQTTTTPASEVPATVPAPPDVTIPVGPQSTDPCGGLDPIACENVRCAASGGELVGDIATGMCIYRNGQYVPPDVLFPDDFPRYDLPSGGSSRLSTFLLLGGLGVAAYLFFRE